MDMFIRGEVKYYFADFVRKGGGGVTPQIRNSFFAEDFVRKGGRGGTPQIRNLFFGENFVRKGGGGYPPYGQNPQSSIWSSPLGKPVPTIIDEFLEKFQRGGHYGPEWRNISKAYECAFGSEVAETTERTQAISQENVFLKPICEQNSIVWIELNSWMIF